MSNSSVFNMIRVLSDYTLVINKSHISHVGSVVLCYSGSCVYAFRVDETGLDKPVLVHAVGYDTDKEAKTEFRELLYWMIIGDNSSRYFVDSQNAGPYIDKNLTGEQRDYIDWAISYKIEKYRDRLLPNKELSFW